MDGKKLYSGDLLAVSLNKAVSLGIFQPGKSGEMKFQITVPSELNNDFALRNGDVKWIFSVEEDQKKNTAISNSCRAVRKEENSDGYSRKTGAPSGKTAPVKTGDDTGIRFFLILEGVSFLPEFWYSGKEEEKLKRKITGTLLALLISGSSIAASASTVMGISSEYLPEIEEAVENEDPEDGGSETESIQQEQNVVSDTEETLAQGDSETEISENKQSGNFSENDKKTAEIFFRRRAAVR